MGEILEVGLCHGDVLAQSGSLHVHVGGVHSLHVDVVAIDMMIELSLLRVVIVYLVEEFLVEVGPFLECKLLAEESGGHVAGNKSCLDEQCARTAHRVDKVGVALPSGHENHSGSKNLVEWCLHAFLAIASAMQALATGVERKGALVLSHMDVETYVGIGNTDIGALSRLLAELIYDGVLHLVGNKLRVAEFVGEHHGIHCECLVVVEIFRPIHLLYLLIHIICRLGLEVSDGL